MTPAYLQSASETLKALGSQAKGLTAREAEKRLLANGPNLIETKKQVSVWRLFLSQLANPLVIMLLIAVAISAFTGKYFEAVLITAIVIFMAIVGVYLENRANTAVDQLKQLVQQDSTVIRAGKLVQIPSMELVVGDILVLQEGDKVTADARVLEVNMASVDEAILTGESVPVNKITTKLTGSPTIADQKNMIFSGTFLVQGNLQAVVVATGNQTELGKITQKLNEVEEKLTPLQAQLIKLSQILSISTLVLCSVILVLAVLRGQSLIDGLTQSLSLAIAFIPEGLTAVMTVVLALGVKEMVGKQVIVKRLLAAEGLGAINILATDKTGTITTGLMTVEKLWMFEREITIANFNPQSKVGDKVLDIIKFCNNHKGATEIALVKFLEKFGFEFELRERAKEFAFSSSLKRMSVVHHGKSEFNLFTKGAPDILIPLCKYYLDEKTNELIEITPAIRKKILSEFEALARQGYRVLCLAYRDFTHDQDAMEREHIERELVFTALIGLMDPLRSDVNATVSKLKRAGIRPLMITGDHPEIAKTIALQAGIAAGTDTRVITGTELAAFVLGEGKLTEAEILECNIFARVVPEHKELLVELFRQNGYLVAMAGDGLNDVVAISKATIGVGVANAADIVKEAADVIITGSYSALANAVEVGRLVMFRTRLYLHYLLSGNFCQVGVFVLALGFNQPFPLTAVQLLIINLLTDAAPAMAMAFERGGKDIMLHPPKPSTEPIINSYIWRSILVQGFASSLYLFFVFGLTFSGGLVLAQTATFTAYLFQKLSRAFTARSFSESVWGYGVFSNRPMVYAVLLGLAVWVAIVFVVPSAFGMQQLAWQLVGLIAVGALCMPLLEEGLKWWNGKQLGRRVNSRLVK